MDSNLQNLTWPGWQIVRLIGEGAYGKVYEIQRVEDDNVFKAALKVIRIPKNDSEIKNLQEEGMDEESIHTYYESIVKDIRAEYALMAKLRGCPNIVYYDDHMIMEDKDTLGWDILIKMELLRPLSSYVKTVGLSESFVKKCGIELCKALEACQAQNIIHRDIKPGNMFINDYDNIKLGDFGIARTLDRTSTMLTRTGTYPYMAPEIFHGNKAGFSADLYSVGMVLYRYLNNNVGPFETSTKNRTTKSIQEAQDRRFAGEPLPYPKYGSRQLKDIVMRATAYDPARRFRSPREMRHALEQLPENPVRFKDIVVIPEKHNTNDIGRDGTEKLNLDNERQKEIERAERKRREQERKEREYRDWLRKKEEEERIRREKEEEERRRNQVFTLIGGLTVVLIAVFTIFIVVSIRNRGEKSGKTDVAPSSGSGKSSDSAGPADPKLLLDSTVILLGDTEPIRFFDGENVYAYHSELSYYSEPNTVEILTDGNEYRNYIVPNSTGRTTVTGRMGDLELSKDIYVLDIEDATNDVICDTDRIVFSVTDSGAGSVDITLTVAGKSGDEMEARIYTDTGTEFNENIGVTAEAEWDDNVLTATVTNYLSVDKKGELVVVITEKDDPGSLIGFERIPIEIG